MKLYEKYYQKEFKINQENNADNNDILNHDSVPQITQKEELNIKTKVKLHKLCDFDSLRKTSIDDDSNFNEIRTILFADNSLCILCTQIKI
jgi:hypothetical protein